MLVINSQLCSGHLTSGPSCAGVLNARYGDILQFTMIILYKSGGRFTQMCYFTFFMNNFLEFVLRAITACI